ncbi:DUF6299 family protein [Humibacillus xanthopallidus]|uniref:DUF6299 domain-containing protein n=1 Tax=Humibacillus xanthopallidus TaxID=412689 RepID=A0A543HZC8_9MICO|nr:DUF6299 family protein [Humibacillus xanthopallidus]TQM63704.1 hypothetical protein FBY41_0048 [Humibacillus xanthopallidus]
MKTRRFIIAAVAALLLAPMGASTALAAPPGNDIPSGAVAVSVPSTVVQDTSDATTDALDAALNTRCGAPVTNGSVWFTYTDTTGDGLLVDVSGSDFTAGVIIVAGEPTTDSSVVACGPGSAAVRGEAGTTYYVMAFSDTAGVIGGNLVAGFSALPPAPVATLTVEPKATAYRDGSLLLRGTYSCANADGYSSDVEGTVTQTVGRMKIEGFFFVYPLECDGAVHSWEAIVTSSNGLFAGGKATSVSLVFACGVFDCTVVEVNQKLQVTRAGR